MKYCPVCGEPPGEGASCRSCGSTVDATATAAMTRAPAEVLATEPTSLGYAPGTIITQRYRVVSLIGHGSMGEVYRADDLRLGQAVALKFLLSGASHSASRIARFHSEVRHARRITHPNVCRVHDIAEANGRTFLTMEYVDGENLASLLLRIGRLPPEKALAVAREICAGLRAAHEQRVLHRDIKPSNIILDRHGHVRIVDFGLATALDDGQSQERVGTPMYMAPEVLAGQPASVRSDIFSLGVVLHELFFGRLPFHQSAIPGRNREVIPITPAPHQARPDAAIEQTILRCLASSPEDRPASVAMIASVLPGGDPLAIAVEAGETPSPALVAAAGGEGGLSPRGAARVLAGFLAALAALFVVAPHANMILQDPPRRPPEVMIDRARTLAEQAGVDAPEIDRVWCFSINRPQAIWKARHDGERPGARVYLHGPPGTTRFWYRQSPVLLVHNSAGPALPAAEATPGMFSVVFDADSRLLRYTAVVAANAPVRMAPDWTTFFSAAGLNAGQFAETTPTDLPAARFDSMREWTEATGAAFPLRVVAASWHGHPASFKVVFPWVEGTGESVPQDSQSGIVPGVPVLLLILLLVSGCAVHALRNLRRGRADLGAAGRLAFGIGLLALVCDLAISHFVADPLDIALVLWAALGNGLGYAGVACLVYLALEPDVRARWPHMLIGSTRLLSGRPVDPIVAGDVLLGLAVGTTMTLIDQGLDVATVAAHARWAFLNFTPQPAISSSPEALASSLQSAIWGLMGSVALIGVAFLAGMLHPGRRWPVALGGLAVLAVSATGGYVSIIQGLINASTFALISVLLLLRRGLLPVAVALGTLSVLDNVPLSVDFSGWIWTRAAGPVLAIVLLAFACWTVVRRARARPAASVVPSAAPIG